MMMRAVCVRGYTTNVEDVEIIEVPKPSAQPHQLLIKVHVAAANPVDVYAVGGLMMKAGWKLTFPFTPGYEFSGVVEAVGSAVQGWAPGQQCFGLNWGAANQDSQEGDAVASCFAEYVAISAKKVSRKPSGVSFECAAGLSLCGTAAYQAVHECGEVGEGCRTLILGGSTCTGSLALQLCRSQGSRFVAVTCSSASVSYVQQFRPDVIVPYDREKWYLHPQCKRFDFVLDLAGAATTLETLKTSEDLITTGAAFVTLVNPLVGHVAQRHPPFSYARFFCLHQDSAQQALLAERMACGQLSLPIAAVHPFTRQGVQDMLREVKAGRAHGKHVLRICED